MKKGFPGGGKGNWNGSEDNEKISLGNLDLINLRLDFPSDREAESPRNTPFDRGSGNSHKSHHSFRPNTCDCTGGRTSYTLPKGNGLRPNNVSSQDILLLYSKDKHKPKIIKTEPIRENDFLYPSKKKISQKTVDVVIERRGNRPRSCLESGASRSFPFKPTPSGNLKVQSSQVVFASKKLSVLVADPRQTKVDFCEDHQSINGMAHDNGKHSPMETLMSQAGGFSSIGSLIANTPVRGANKEGSEYESKQTSEILDPELNLGRLGYSGSESINWEKVKLPEKQNLYLELYRRITNNTNADCKIYIDNEEFNCHLIVLQCYSELFDAYVAVKKVELPSDRCSVSAFSFIYDWMVTGEPSYIHLSRENVLDIFISAKYLKIKDLVEQCWAFIDNVEVFNEDTAFLLYMDAKRRNLPEVKELMLPRIQNFFLILVSSQDWLELEADDVKNFLKSNYIVINCEMEIFMSAVRWLKHDWQTRDQNKYEILDCVRFGNIAPWQLVDIKRNPENPDFMDLAADPRICKMIDDGLAYVIIKYWYGQENEDFQHWNAVLGLQEPPARNWNGPDKTYFTYREFLIYLDQYRRTNLLDQGKSKLAEKSAGKMKDGKHVPEKASPRVPTMEEFMCKKKPGAHQRKVNKVMS